jgi:hypothetical protein
LFQILEDMLPALLHLAWRWLWVCHLQPLLCRHMLLLYLICWGVFNHEGMSNYIKGFSRIC